MEEKKTVKHSIMISITLTLLMVGLVMGIFTCCADSSPSDGVFDAVRWESALSGGQFSRTGTNYDCPYTALTVFKQGSGYLVRLHTQTDYVEGTMTLDGLNGELRTVNESFAVRLSEKNLLIRLTDKKNTADFTYGK